MVKDSSEKRRPIDKATRDAVWIKYMGDSPKGICYCCRIRPIHFTEFQVGHNKPVSKGGKDNISNLRPICGSCNRGMGDMNLEEYRKEYYGSISEPQKIPTRTKPKPKKSRVEREMRKVGEFW